MIKKILILLVILAIIFAAAVYIYRQAIIQYYGEKLIRDNLPGYIRIDKIKFDLGNNVFSIGGLKLISPPGYIAKYTLAIEEVRCVYRIRGGIIPSGLDILEISFKRPEVAVERLPDNRINLVEMNNFIKTFPVKAPSGPVKTQSAEVDVSVKPAAKNLSSIIKLPHSFKLTEGRIFFIDSVPYKNPYEIIISSVNGEVSITFNDSYTAISDVAFTLEGNLNGASDETIKWIGFLNPKTPKLTMSNRFEVSNLKILTFEPYYDAQSPIVFEEGKFSGELIFDFDDGNIGSSNEIRLSNVVFRTKAGRENTQFWDTSVEDLVKYLTSSSGDIIFDFKIKGDMSHPQFYLGPISKRALASMAIDKISSYAINQISKQTNQAAGGTVDKAQDYISMFKELIKKK